jgi:hypothetical protein
MVVNLVISALAFLLLSGWAPLTFVEASGHGNQGAEREASSGDLEEYSVRSRASLKSQTRREKKRISLNLLPNLPDPPDRFTMATSPREALLIKRPHQPFHRLHTVFRI